MGIKINDTNDIKLNTHKKTATPNIGKTQSLL